MQVKEKRTSFIQHNSPRSFSGLMDMYEQNYLRLRTLVPDLEIADEMVSVSEGHMDLFLTVTERCKFTTECRLTYRFAQENGDDLLLPDLCIKIYHDARIAEVISIKQRHQKLWLEGKSLLHKWNMNRFLFKWLGYCHHQGHFFNPVSKFSDLKKPA